MVALLAAIPWLGLVAHDRHPPTRPQTIRFGDVIRTRLGLAMAIFFGLQSMQAYAAFGWFAQLWRDNGYTAGQAGALVGLLAAVSIPLSLWAPAAAARREDQRVLLTGIMLCYPVGYVGLLVAPHDLAIVWAVLIGIGAVCFPIVLTLIGLRARTPDGTAALSGTTQSLGYLLAVVGPFGVGLLYDVERRLDLAARPADVPDGAADRVRAVRRPAGLPRGPARQPGGGPGRRGWTSCLDDAERQQLLAGRPDLDLGAHLRADPAVVAGRPAAVLDLDVGGRVDRVLPVGPEPVLVEPGVEVVPGQDLVVLALAGGVPVEVDRAVGQRLRRRR